MQCVHVNKNTLMVGWEKPVSTRRTTTKICIVTRRAVRTYAGDREWLNARGKKSLRSARWHLLICSLSLAIAFSYSHLHSPLSVQCYCTTIFTNISTRILYCCTTIFTIISASCTTIFTKRFRSTYIIIFTYTSSDSTDYAARLFASR